MTDTGFTRSQSIRSSLTQTASNQRTHRVSLSVRWLAVIAFMLFAAPKLRIMIGTVPLNFIDAVILLLFLITGRKSGVKWSSFRPLPTLVTLYLAFIYIGELRGMAIYDALLESLYMIGQLSLAVSLFFIVPRVVRGPEAAAFVLKGLVAGVICASTITIMYALAPTRPLVMDTILSYNFLVPNAEQVASQTLALGGDTTAMRGYSLIGVSTATTGFLGIAWGLTFLAANWPGIRGNWSVMANISSIITPVAILLTYGRVAWLTVVVIGAMILFFGFARGRLKIVTLLVGFSILIYQVGWHSESFLFEDVAWKTKRTIYTPMEDQGTAIRIFSYTQPVLHLSENPVWLVAGAGRVGQRLSQRREIEAELRDLAGLSTHSGFGMAYYAYGMVAAIIHVLLIWYGGRLILRHLRKQPSPGGPLYKITWQAFLMSWTGLLFWWLSAHGMVADFPGVDLFFLLYGLMIAFDNILTVPEQNAVRQ